MLHRFITDHHDQIADRAMVLSRTRNQLPAGPPDDEISTFLSQASAMLQQGRATEGNSLTATARRNGAQMLRSGRTIVDVVQCYGDVCQAVTALAAESRTPISAHDFGVFNQCLDDAMGNAVGEYDRIAEERRGAAEVQRLGTAAHELRDQLHTAQLALRLLQPQAAGDGLAEQILTRALANLSQQVERMLSEVRLGAGVQRRDAIPLVAFLDEVATTAALKAASRGVSFTMESDATGTVEGDRPLLMSAVMNLVHNAVKFTASGGDVRVTARVTPTRLLLAVQDQCGGLPDMTKIGNAFSDRRGADRSGLGLGLSIAKAVIESHAGEIAISNTPGFGCIFTIDLPLVADPPRFRSQQA